MSMPTERMETVAAKTAVGKEATVKPRKRKGEETSPVEREFALEMIRRAKEQGLDLTGGLLRQFTRTVLETALDEEMTGHLGRARHEKSAGGRDANTRNGTTAKTVVTDAVGPLRIEVPRDRDGSFEPVIVRKRQRRLNDVDEVVLSLHAKGLTTGEISVHFSQIYGASVSKETVNRITEKVVAEINEWSTCPLDPAYAAVFIDAIRVKVRDGQVASRAFYAAVGVGLEGSRDVLGIWGSPVAEGARHWLAVLTELKNRGVGDVFFLVCDGLEDLPDAVGVVWPKAIVQTCVIHLMHKHVPVRVQERLECHRTRSEADLHGRQRDRGRGGARRNARQVGREVPRRPGPVDGRVGEVHPVPRLRRGDPARDLLDERDREPQRPVSPLDQRGHFPDERAALKCLYLTSGHWAGPARGRYDGQHDGNPH